MINYGEHPAADEIEVTLFGPGYGEALAIHLGQRTWLLIDSCIDPDTRAPASASYLDQLGVGSSDVRAIIASHWHDDHVRGISQLASKYPKADFMMSAVFNDDEAAAFLAAYNGSSSAGLSRGSKELFSILKARTACLSASHRSVILQATINGKPVMVTALSPLPAALNQSVAHLAQYKALEGQAINHAPELHPNLEAVAVHIDIGGDAVLLGADLEDHKTYGWSALVADKWVGARKRASAYKVAHHGSYTGDCPGIWSGLLTQEPMSCLTPFTLGSHRLPTDNDKARIKEHTKRAYISSAATRRPEMENRQLKRLGDICKKVARANNGFGAVRLRKQAEATGWSIELFGSAQAF